MELREFFSEDAIQLELEGETKDDILKELIALLKLDDKSEGMLYKMLKRRENLGSTGIGRGIAIPHCRSLVVNKLRVAFGRKKMGVDFKAIDEKPVHFFFLIVASFSRRMPSADRNSVTTTSAPKRRHRRRNGDSETPAMGARYSGTLAPIGNGNRFIPSS